MIIINEALIDQLFDATFMKDGMVKFNYKNCRVTVNHDGGMIMYYINDICVMKVPVTHDNVTKFLIRIDSHLLGCTIDVVNHILQLPVCIMNIREYKCKEDMPVYVGINHNGTECEITLTVVNCGDIRNRYVYHESSEEFLVEIDNVSDRMEIPLYNIQSIIDSRVAKYFKQAFSCDVREDVGSLASNIYNDLMKLL